MSDQPMTIETEAKFSRQRSVSAAAPISQNSDGSANSRPGVTLESLLRSPATQRIARLTAVVLVAMLLFPPFRILLPNGAELNLGYGFILSPPETSSGRAGTVNLPLLLTQAGFALAIAGLLTLLARRKA